jgi:hypothetical protein
MDESITITVNILLKILPHKMNHLHTLAKIFDANVPYYTGEFKPTSALRFAKVRITQ